MSRVTISVLLILVLLSAIGVVLSRHEARYQFTEIQGLKKTAKEVQAKWSRLQLEYSTWAAPARIDAIARSELSMQDVNQSIFLLSQNHKSPLSNE